MRKRNRTLSPGVLSILGESYSLDHLSPMFIRSLARHLPKIDSLDNFYFKVGAAHNILYAGLLFIKNEDRKKLERANRAAEKLIELISGLSEDEKNLIALAARPPMDPGPDVHRGIAEIIHRGNVRERTERIGRARVEDAEQAIANLSEWLADAAVSVHRRERGERRVRSGPATRRAVQYLREAWIEQTGAEPTISTDAHTPGHPKSGPFINLCEAVIYPVFDELGLERPSVTSAVKSVLYPPREASPGNTSPEGD